ncbi:MAG: tyrosine-type recombinase/integrase, partial [Chloroflexota bacterium]
MALQRLVKPVEDALAEVEGRDDSKDSAVAALLRSCGREQLVFWGWDEATWLRVLGPSQAEFFAAHEQRLDGRERQFLMTAAYRLGCWTDVRALGDFKRVPLAEKVFGQAVVRAAVQAVCEVVAAWGYASHNQMALGATLCEALLLNRSPNLGDLTADFLEEFRRDTVVYRRALSFQLSRALAALGVLTKPLAKAGAPNAARGWTNMDDMAPSWVGWVKRWDETSTLSPVTRTQVRLCLLKAGRWLHRTHPHVSSPEQWNRELAVAYVAAIVRMQVGDYIGSRNEHQVIGNRRGQPLSARSRRSYISAMCVAFRDWQEWGWLHPRFDPGRVFATPRSVKALIGPAPRTIAADVWAKLLWAGLNLNTADLPRDYSSRYYPVELLRALSIVWLFAGL